MSQASQVLKIGIPALGAIGAAYAWNQQKQTPAVQYGGAQKPPKTQSKAKVTAPSPTKGKKLLAVIAFNRHGDRTPTCLLRATKTEARLWRERVPPEVPLTSWSDVQAQLRVANLVDDHDPGCGMKPGTQGKREVNVRPLPWWCGAITFDGLEQMEALGGWYRDRYAIQYKFLPASLSNPESLSKVSVKATNFSRTMLSVDALLVGLYPPDPRLASDPIKIDVKVNSTGPIWYPNSFHSETDVFTRNENLYNNQHPNLFAENFKEICEYYNSTIPERAFLLMDPLLYRESTGIDKWPVHLDPVVQDFKTKFDKYYCFKVCRTRQDLKSSVGYLLRYIQDYLENSTDKFTIVCGHDTTLIPVMLALTNDKFVKIPEYGASLVFEVWLDENDGKRYVQILYDKEDMELYGETRGLFLLDDLKDWWADLVV